MSQEPQLPVSLSSDDCVDHADRVFATVTIENVFRLEDADGIVVVGVLAGTSEVVPADTTTRVGMMYIVELGTVDIVTTDGIVVIGVGPLSREVNVNFEEVDVETEGSVVVVTVVT